MMNSSHEARRRPTTKNEREKSLVNARRACLLLVEYVVGENLLILGDPHRDAIGCLLEEFGRLDSAARKQAKRSVRNGKRGGRPPLDSEENLSWSALYRRARTLDALGDTAGAERFRALARDRVKIKLAAGV